MSNIYNVNPEYPTVELEPVVNIDGYNINTYELFHVSGADRYYRKTNQIQNYFEEHFYKA